MHSRTFATTAMACLVAAWIGVGGCTTAERQTVPAASGRFGSDLAFLREHGEVILLTDQSGAQVAVAPGYQGRVMTSTTGGSDAPSFGWLGRTAIAMRQRVPHMNVFGGEDRFWLGPEGGHYGLYFKPGDPFDFEHWQVPEPLDWGAWDVASRSATTVRFLERMTLENHSRTRIDLEVDRTVRLLTSADISSHLRESLGASVRGVAFESSNSVTNSGSSRWLPESGLVSVWILGMFNPSTDTTIAIPFAPGPESALGPVVNDAYFGKVPADRLIVKDSVILFRGDGQYRSKIGLSPSRALSIAGSYNASEQVLTLVQYTRSSADRYVNSMWETQKEPYKGDVINSYNDGPPAPGQPPLGPFYELETSSPALDLAPGQRYTHVHRTFHLVGPPSELDRIARATLGMGLDGIGSGSAR
jgi:Family of unknown function (DUF6786)